MLKVIVLGFLVVCFVLLAVILMQPDEFRVSRSLPINASAEKIFPEINNLRSFNEWNPWAKIDPDSKETYTGPAEGVGAKMSWEGGRKAGKGSMTNTESRPHEFVRFRMEFVEPFEATHTAEFVLQPEGEGTVVTWSIYGEKTFIGKAMGLVLSTDKMIGEPFEKGLNDLKARMEK